MQKGARGRSWVIDMSQLLIIDSLKSFSLVPYFVNHVKVNHPDCVVLEMAHLLNEQMWNTFKRVSPDVVFVDFCNESATVLTQRVKELPKKPKIIIRLHGYESDGQVVDGKRQTRLMDQVDWSEVSALITVSAPYYDLVKAIKPEIADRLHMISNGIDLSRFAPQTAEEMGDSTVAYAGFLHRWKGMALLRTVMASFPEKHFHIAGRYQEPMHLQTYMDSLPLKNVTYHGWVDTASFLRGKRFIISTSIAESFGMSIAEGMACGLTPLVHHWPGAHEIWPPECCWKSFDELEAILASPKDPAWCRSWIEDRYSMDNCIQKIASLIF